jgi:hypothetical protein
LESARRRSGQPVRAPAGPLSGCRKTDRPHEHQTKKRAWDDAGDEQLADVLLGDDA